METNKGIMISYRYKASDYLELNLNLRSNRSNWEKAIDIFNDRIYGRFFDQIHILNRDPEKNGFSSMAICCLLIDCMYQFEYGTKGHKYNHRKYIQILREHLGSIFDSDEKAERFYCDIRCGILHSAETMNGSQLTILSGAPVIALSANNEHISVNVIGIAKSIEQYIDNYCERLYYGERTTRSNFMKKMQYLCDRPSFYD